MLDGGSTMKESLVALVIFIAFITTLLLFRAHEETMKQRCLQSLNKVVPDEPSWCTGNCLAWGWKCVH